MTSAEPDGAPVPPSAGDVDEVSVDGTGTATATTTDAPPPVVDVGRLEQEGEVAADYLEGLLDIADLDGDIDMDVEGERAVVSIVAGDAARAGGASGGEAPADLTRLVGDDGEVLDALQELTRLAVHQALGERSRLLLDIAGFRARKRLELSEMGRTAAERAAATREPVRLRPMTPFERKVIHDAVAAAGQRSESEGVEPERFVVVLPVENSA
jgi:spoIIIJ-associated protein